MLCLKYQFHILGKMLQQLNITNSSYKCEKESNFLTNPSDCLEDQQEMFASHHSFEIGLSLFLILGLVPQETDLEMDICMEVVSWKET